MDHQLVFRRDGRLVAQVVEGADGGVAIQVAPDTVVAPLVVGAPVRVRPSVDEIVFAEGDVLDSELADARGRPDAVHPADKRRAESVGSQDLERAAVDEVRFAADRRDAADVSYRRSVVAAADAGASFAEIARAARITRQSARALVERSRAVTS